MSRTLRTPGFWFRGDWGRTTPSPGGGLHDLRAVAGEAFRLARPADVRGAALAPGAPT